ncbi:MAG: tRNA (adenine22-N1)-methyltransferase [Epulopiscium sp.]|jgi:tRNA (adenine22-N1)-methyltransferase|uniref:SAM-dependent methyltransferase n=1 Tax=Defluviitalea raffinosedens TaxID=1450156 RepID=A0A7C8HG52_9FIRM|nr:class I SAM-dependent methyltransferase [Defluviitalea raffinosedens]MBZ4667965.1 SAM-dependent methyltransferase [Defluviitaleaceae bacterium]MDK2788315.1 tRNA (adenine22-N1)-methyltransferase [Candidatus Epulonipiscium sp.]KAE9636995.1 SAM-dependent methyltransferase [Defluviitalea raffinosedens]MBM7685251.1 tRNA (adenine22-N1)-methyltransferase [Defluviitalea raffinosedens]HHW67310.1 SAM-dependent methyltransferase [Candidatus Epulonipiscium sp.]
MELSKRLYTIAQQVPQGAIVADIGTDHGYVPIYLYQKKIIKKAIATDINRGPLKRAEKNIKAHNAEQIIATRLGNGLEPIQPNEVDTLILAGMGGMLIIDILNNRLNLVKGVNRIILQPQLDQKEVRQYLHKIYFKIINEEIVYEDNKYYWIIVAEPGEEEYDDIKYYLFGKKLLESKSSILMRYIKEKLIQLRNILEKLNETSTDNTLKRINEIEQEIRLHEEALKCL